MFCSMCLLFLFFFFFFKQKTAYEMRISDWSSDVCSSDLQIPEVRHRIFQWNGSKIGDSQTLNSCPSEPTDKAVPLSLRIGKTWTEHHGVGCGDQKKIGRASCRERVCQYV